MRRPAEDEREVLDEGVLDVDEGLVGDDWRTREPTRAARRRGSGSRTQVTLMNARAIALIAGDARALAARRRPALCRPRPEPREPADRHQAGGGTALVEVTDMPHTGCAKFSARFGPAAIRFVNSPSGRARRLRGMYVRVVERGIVRPGDAIRKV